MASRPLHRRWTVIASALLCGSLALVVMFTNRRAFYSPLAIVVVAAIGAAAVMLQTRLRKMEHTPTARHSAWLNEQDDERRRCRRTITAPTSGDLALLPRRRGRQWQQSICARKDRSSPSAIVHGWFGKFQQKPAAFGAGLSSRAEDLLQLLRRDNLELIKRALGW